MSKLIFPAGPYVVRRVKWIFVFGFVCARTHSQQTDTIKVEKWNYHFQLTAIAQGHPSFKSAYSGQNSLNSDKEYPVLSVTSTLFLGRKLWKGAAVFFNPEIAGGAGISTTRGVAGFPNGETFRIGDPSPTLYIARAFLQQQIPLDQTEFERQEADLNQFADSISKSRLMITVGKFSMADFFDRNKYSNDPRTQFLNWGLMSNGGWDYPANTRGYTSGIVFELFKGSYALRLAGVVVPKMANGSKMDWNITKAHSIGLELEKKWMIRKIPGTGRILGFYSSSHAPNYRTTILETRAGDSTALGVITGATEGNKYGGVKYGLGLSVDQDLSKTVGLFTRLSWNDGKTASWAFAEIDESFSFGINIKGDAWKRPDDNLAAAYLMNGISKDHRDFLDNGLYGLMIGDGKLTHYGQEEILEIYYNARITKTLFATLDYQFINHPAYNKDRGPVHVYAARVHISF